MSLDPRDLSENTDLYRFDSQALAQLAVGTSVFIACVLTAADILPLWPISDSLLSLALRLVGQWIVVVVVWFVGFQAIAHTLKFISKGVVVTDYGIKLSRFDRVIPWTSIKAISLEPNLFFTRLFQLKTPARKLTLLFHFELKNGFMRKLLFPNYIPSFFFNKQTFDALVADVAGRTQLLPNLSESMQADLPYTLAFCALDPDEGASVRTTYQWLDRQRVVVTLMILFLMVTVLGQRAMGYYCYNTAGVLMRQYKLSEAEGYYRQAVRYQPAFAAGWNALGQVQYKLAQIEHDRKRLAEADVCWRRAILLKLDYVEPRLNLARVSMDRGDLVVAQEFLDKVSFLAPDNALYILDQAELSLRKGDYKRSAKLARLLLVEADAGRLKHEYAFKANCIMAMVYLQKAKGNAVNANLAEAEKYIGRYSQRVEDYRDGEDFTFFLEVSSRLQEIKGNKAQAQRLAAWAASRRTLDQVGLLSPGNLALDR